MIFATVHTPLSRDIQAKIPLPQAIWNEFWLSYCQICSIEYGNNWAVSGIEYLAKNEQGYIMGKRTGGLLCVLLLALLPAGCQFIRIEEGERTPLEYTIVKQEEIPEEISELMEQKKKKVFQMTYQVGDIRYLMKGYGEQLTGGYSIQVEEVSESENAVFCKTRLIGPEKADAGSEPSYPCIVLKIRETEKPIEFLGFIIK